MKILFVCTGNTCRSPMAEVIFTNMVCRNGQKDVIVRSAGTDADVGLDMMLEARRALSQNGEELPKTPHRAAQFVESMRKDFDHIICLNNRLSGVRNLYIEDPWRLDQEGYNIVCRQLQTELALLYKEIFDKGD